LLFHQSKGSGNNQRTPAPSLERAINKASQEP
jgi:hypothetical protein